MSDTIADLAARARGAFGSPDPAAAISAFRSLLSADPNRPDDWFNLALVQRRARQFTDALASYDEALQRGIAGPEEVHLNRAVIHADDLLDPEAARADLERALSLAPNFVPALINLGNLHEDHGARAEAEAAYARAHAIEPGNPVALMRLAEVTQFDSDDHVIIRQLQAMLLRSDLPPLERADIGFALGRALDQAGSYDDAFSAYLAANTASAGLAGSAYDPAAQERFVDRVIAVFGTAHPAAPDDTAAPIFICGMFRSGSTLAERVLAAHSAVSAGGELELVPMLAADFAPYPDRAAALSVDDCTALRDRYLAGLAELSLSAGGLTDKRPDNFLHVGLIKRMFPAAKIIHTRRNPLDNCLSVLFAHLDPRMNYAQSLDSAAHWYAQQERLFDHWRALHPGDVHTVDYDALVSDPQTQIAALLEFLGLPFEDACLEPHVGEGTVRTASAWQVREPLYARSSGRWRNYAAHLAPLFKVFGRPDTA
ncbi:tetratricopeptide repeat-containing sulfotransferase family protein [Qipengyuania marisflavi]|uniref:Tetratricopeptide repeat protein n=1 Tax=Qipengyuania marisflavi TaxID=2486356 RepID=A0A5S3P8P8_9SPHN|nr:sulfotransferase [Qipengyuania marisflavi]TMM49874.1 tetratricopeptide repeat protein [Qipengyuania marisflavi]